MKKTEYKTLSFDIKEITEDENEDGVKTGTIKGYAAAFNNIDLGNDRIKPGAFKRTIKNKKGMWPILADHNWNKQIGINAKAKEDEFGLLVESKINLEVESGREKFALAKQAMEMGYQLGMSIGYRALKFNYEDDKKFGQVRNLEEVKLFEHSIVTFPMNELATITDAKSLDAQEATAHLKGLVERLKNSGLSSKNITQLIEETLEGKTKKIDSDNIAHSIQKLSDSIKCQC